MQDEGNGTLQYDPYNDGLAIEITLDRPATEADVAAARALLSEWLEAYGEQGLGYRNCDADADVGATRFTLWADRIRHADGSEAAVGVARGAAARASEVLPTLSAQVASANEAADRDMVARLGDAPFQVRAGGDLLADVRATEAPWYNGGLRPSFTPLAVMGLLRVIVRRYETEVPWATPSLVGGLGVIALTWASRHHLRWGQIVMSGVASSVFLAHALVSLLQPSAASAIALLQRLGIFVGFAWVVSWIWLERNRRVW